MKALLFLLLLIPVFAFDTGEKYLRDNAPYQKPSYFKQQVYREYDWKSFSKLKEVNSAVEPGDYDMHLISAALFYSTNKLRSEKGLPPFKFSPELRDAAAVHTQQMVEKNFLDHFNSKNAELRAPYARMKMFGVKDAHELGENIDMTEFYTPDKTTYWQLAEIIVKELYDSPPHRKAMLSKNFTNMGCAAMFCKSDKRNGINPIKTTQDFSTNY